MKVHPLKYVLTNDRVNLIIENELKHFLNLKSIYRLPKVTGDDY